MSRIVTWLSSLHTQTLTSHALTPPQTPPRTGIRPDFDCKHLKMAVGLSEDVLFHIFAFLPLDLILRDIIAISPLISVKLERYILDASFLRSREKRCYEAFLYEKQGTSLVAASRDALGEDHGFPQLYQDLLYFWKEFQTHRDPYWTKGVRKIAFKTSQYGFSFDQFRMEVDQLQWAMEPSSNALVLSEPDFILHYIRKNPDVLKRAPSWLRRQKWFCRLVVKAKPRAVVHLPEWVRSDRSIMRGGILVDGTALRYCSDALRDDEDFVHTAVRQSVEAYQFSSERLQSDRQCVRRILEMRGMALRYLPYELAIDPVLARVAVQQNGLALMFAKRLEFDKDLVLCAVQQNGIALKHAPMLRNNKEVVLRAVTNLGTALQYASIELRGDKEVIFAAMKQNVEASQFIADELKQDQPFMRELVRRFNLTFSFRNDKEITIW